MSPTWPCVVDRLLAVGQPDGVRGRQRWCGAMTSCTCWRWRSKCAVEAMLCGQAGHMVAVDCPLPARLNRHDFLHCTQLDLRRWYAALVGRQWDGTVTTMADARALAGRWRRDGRANRPNPRGTRGEQPTYRLFCRSHLLVEVLDAHPNRRELDLHMADVGYPAPCDVGHLEWDNPQGRACCFCNALLLRSEQATISGTTALRGRYCCSTGCVVVLCICVLLIAVVLLTVCNVERSSCAHRQVDPPPLTEWPLWMRSLWLGHPGREHGNDGLLRGTARRFSRQLNSALSLASQDRDAARATCTVLAHLGELRTVRTKAAV